MSAVTLESSYDKLEDVPEAFRPLYAEKGGKFEVIGIKGLKPESAFATVQEALRKERADHKSARDTLAGFTGLGKSVDEIHALLDEVPQLRLAADGKVKELTDAQKNALTAPLSRQVEKLTKELGEATTLVKTFQEKERVRTIADAVRGAATELKVLPGAVDDVLLWANATFEVNEDGKVVVKDGVNGVPAGLDAKAWLQDMQGKKAHWWPASEGGDARGSGGHGSLTQNFWSKAHWNVTKQGEYTRVHGVEKAAAMAKAAGSSLGAIAPPK